MKSYIEINPGPLSSIASLHNYIGPKLYELRKAYSLGKSPEVIWHLTSLGHNKHLNISTLTSFLAIAKKVSDFIGRPQKVIFHWNQEILSFLKHISFIKISQELEILDWDDRFIGGNIIREYNPNTGIIYFDSIPDKNIYKDPILMAEYRSSFKEKAKPNLLLRLNKVLSGTSNNERRIVANTSIELILNSLIHGQEYAFVGVQRSKKRISVSVCDGGVGFLRSLKGQHPYLNKGEPIMDQTTGILIGSYIQNKIYGLKSAINEIIRVDDVLYKDVSICDGWVNISSFDSEILWQKKNWIEAKRKLDSIEINNQLPSMEELLGPQVSGYLDFEKIRNGYWRRFNYRLYGTRVAFEIVME